MGVPLTEITVPAVPFDDQTLTAQYGPIFIMVGVSVGLALAMWALAGILGPKNPTPEKSLPFECGSDSTGAQHTRLSVKFYLTAILFVVFDIEAVFLYPWAVLYQNHATGLSVATMLVEMLAFLVVLTVALIYCWRKGALEWET